MSTPPDTYAARLDIDYLDRLTTFFRLIRAVGRWSLWVQTYAFLLVTDRYPPFSPV